MFRFTANVPGRPLYTTHLVSPKFLSTNEGKDINNLSLFFRQNYPITADFNGWYQSLGTAKINRKGNIINIIQNLKLITTAIKFSIVNGRCLN